MNIDNTEIKIFNINNNFNLFNINAKQYDTTGSRGIMFRLIKDNLAMDLTNVVVNIGGKKADGMDIFNSCDILERKSGLIQVNLTTQMLTTAGILKLELILMKDSMRLSSYPFEINIVPSITNFQAIQSSDEFGALTQALSKVNDIIINTNDIKNLKDTNIKLVTEVEINRTNIDNNVKQIKTYNDTLYDLEHNWFSDCSNSLCINGFTSLKVYAEGVYYITGTAVTILESIDHSAMKNGQCIYFIAETCDQTANIKFPKSLSSSAVYTPKGQDFWITGRDNGDTIYIMQKIGGALRFRSI